jgi:hypothetical protein
MSRTTGNPPDKNGLGMSLRLTARSSISDWSLTEGQSFRLTGGRKRKGGETDKTVKTE